MNTSYSLEKFLIAGMSLSMIGGMAAFVFLQPQESSLFLANSLLAAAMLMTAALLSGIGFLFNREWAGSSLKVGSRPARLIHPKGRTWCPWLYPVAVCLHILTLLMVAEALG